MQKEHGQIISQIRNEFEFVKDAYNRLKEENDVLTSEKQALIDKVDEQNIIIKELKSHNENLLLAKAVGGGDSEKESIAGKRIDELVAEIDKCIALLNR